MPGSPAALAVQPLFAPLAPLLTEMRSDRLPNTGELNAMVETMPAVHGAIVDRRLCFVPPDGSSLNYEDRILQTGEIITRPQNWHDLFNALVWLRFPRTKAALNALHVRELGRRPESVGRGPLRDAATLFDESGIVVLSADPALLQLLAARAWKTLFWAQRTRVVACMRFLVFGHGLYDALRSPYYLMCGRAASIEVTQEIIDRDAAAQCAHVDSILAERFAAGDWYPRPRAMLALPLLGIPGVTAASESPAYYDDTEQFRPKKSWSDPNGSTLGDHA